MDEEPRRPEEPEGFGLERSDLVAICAAVIVKALGRQAASDRLNAYARVVRSGPPAPFERPPSRFQSRVILKVDP
jgi:hypothetical protein